MAVTGYGADDMVPLSGGTMTGTLSLQGSPPLMIPYGAAAGLVATSDSSGNVSWAAPSGGTGWYSAQAYGATGNGSTDDTAAIQAAINAASAAGGGVVYLPAGDYLVNGSGGTGLTIPANIRLLGMASPVGLGTSTPAWTNLICGSNSLTQFLSVTGSFVSVEGFTITAANSGCTVPPVSCSGVARLTLKDVYATGLGSVFGDGLTNSHLSNVHDQACNAGAGFWLPNCSGLTVSDCSAAPAGTPGYAGLSGVTLNSALVSGTSYTSLTVTALSAGLTAGQVLIVGSLTGKVQPVMVAAAASSGATSVTVRQFTANAAYATGSAVQQYTMGYVISGSKLRMTSTLVGSAWAWPKFLYALTASYIADTETTGGSGIDSLYCNGVTLTAFSGFNNNSGSWSGYAINLVNGTQRCNFLGGVGNGGATGIVNISGSGGNATDLTFTGLLFYSNGSQTGAGINIGGVAQRITVTGCAFYANGSAQPFILDAGTTSFRGNTYTGNSFGGQSSSLVQLVQIGGTTPGTPGITIADNAGATGNTDGPSDWYNVRFYGATGNGSTDDTAAIQAAMAAAAANYGGVIYFPVGEYVVSSSLAWAGGSGDNYAPVRFLGASQMVGGSPPGGSQILWKPGGSAYDIFNIGTVGASQGVYFEHLNIQPFSDPGANPGHIAINATGGNLFLTNVTINSNQPSSHNVTTGVLATTSGRTLLQNCVISAWTQGVWMSSGQIMTISDSVISTVIGTGSGCVRMDGTANTLRIRNSQTQGGDRGLYVIGAGLPGAVFIHDFEINNPYVAGVELVNGSQFWAHLLGVSAAGVPTTTLVHGLVTDSAYQGFCTLTDSIFQDTPGHGIWLQGGTGFSFTGTSIGGCGEYATNSYDDLHIAAAVSYVTVNGCHFDVDPFNTGGSARSAIYIESGASQVVATGNSFAASGYATGQVVQATPVATTTRLANNLHYNPVGKIASPPAVAATTVAVTNNTGVDCMVIVTCSATANATSISVGGNATGITSSVASAVLPPVMVPAGQTITLTYTNAPTWTWWGS